MKEKYKTTVLPNTGLFVRRDIAFVLVLFAISVLTTADLYLDDVNIISDTFTALLLVWTFIKLKPYYKNYKLGVILSAVYGVFTVVGSRLSYNFVTDSFPTKTWENTKVFRDFITMYPVRIAEAALLFVTVFYAFKGVRAIIDGHCGYIPSTMSEEYRSSRLAAIRKEVCAKVWLCLAIAAITAAVSGLYEFILSLDLFISPIWWIISFVASLAFFASAVYMMSAVNEEVESRYMLD
jgi:ABC-type multidrug transport system fused ATPase/permease subunit